MSSVFSWNAVGLSDAARELNKMVVSVLLYSREIIVRPSFMLLLFLSCATGADKTSDAVPPPLHPNEVSVERDKPGPGVDIHYKGGRPTGRITRHDAAGHLLWTAQLDGRLGAHREPHVLHDADRIYLSHNDGVTALDMKAGKVAWHAKGPADRLFLSGKLLLATECTSGEEPMKQGRWLTGRSIATGAEVFNIGLPVKDFDPWPIREVAGLFLVQAPPAIGSRGGGAYLIDQKGKVRHKLGRLVLDGRTLGEERVLLTAHNVVRLSAADKELWTIPLEWRDQLDEGGMLDVAGGDLLIFRFRGNCDSGVEVMRFDPRTGKKVWATTCPRLGVGHSKYFHQAVAVIEGQQVRVTSRGSYGSFVETLDFKTGKRIKRASSKPEK
jgi:hypothetical protein